MKIVSAEFVAAASKPADIPRARHPELALAGRSNVGKSSLINRLTARKKLARISQTPGCTRGLIFFEINESLTLVDLPGYGWARRSLAERASWKKLVEAYLTGRRALAGVLILIDVRRGAQEEELQLAEFLEAHSIPMSWVATKCDKLARAKLSTRLVELEADLGAGTLLTTSAKSGDGVDRVWDWIRDAAGAVGRIS
ncbi:MAG TPA: ribosome biogenesis GTP-binding protein YihA/YsxC [Gammaproteobacteria bacterium]